MRQIGSGDVAAILAYSPHKNAMGAWNHVMGYQRDEDNEGMRIGRVMEEPIMRLAADKMGWPGYAKGKPATHPEYPWLRATVDFTVEDAIVECKWCGGWDIRDWYDPHGAVRVPLGYHLQVIEQMAVTGLRKAFVATILQGQTCVLPVEWDAELAADMIAILDRWYRDYIVTETPPVMPDGSKAYSDYLVGKYPRVLQREYLQATEDDEKLLVRLRGYQAAMKHAEKGYRETAQLLQERIKDAQGIAGQCGRVMWIERKAYTTKPAEVKATRYIKCSWAEEKAEEDAA